MTTDDGTAFVITRENSSASDGNISNTDKEKDLLSMDSDIGNDTGNKSDVTSTYTETGRASSLSLAHPVNSDAVEMTTESQDSAYERFLQATQSTVDNNGQGQQR